MKRMAALFLLILTASSLPEVARAAQRVLILTDNSGSSENGSSHVTSLITAFTNAGATVTTNSTELTNGVAMPLSLVTGWDDVIVVTVTGNPIDASDVQVLQNAVSTRASSAFQFFTDACGGCTRTSASDALQIINAAAGWSATLGTATDVSYTGTLTGSYSAAFSGLPTIQSTAYSPILGVPAINVIYTSNAAGSPGPCAVVAPGSASSACVFFSTDVTEFWVAGGISVTQANGLAAAYLNAASSCPLQSGPTDTLNISTVGGGTVAAVPNQTVFLPGSVVQLTASPAAGFLSWSGDATGSTNPLSVTMNSNKNITATFDLFTLNVTAVGGGTVMKLPNQTAFLPGSVVQLTASPAAGFLSWSGDATGSTNPLSVTMNSNKNITATFDITKLPGLGHSGSLLLCLSLLAVGFWLLRRRGGAPKES
jgi:hypothetical protein